MPTATANGLALAYETDGDPQAPPLVLLMGLGMPLVFWPDPFVAGLAAAGFRVIRFDNRDCGHSEKVRGGRLPSIPLAIGRALMRMRVRARARLEDRERLGDGRPPEEALRLANAAGALAYAGSSCTKPPAPACWRGRRGSVAATEQKTLSDYRT